MMQYFSGKELYGDDFSQDEIAKWFQEEAEAYANLGPKSKAVYRYSYHNLNKVHGFDKLPKRKYESVLGIGSAWGYEFEPILDQINQITILEPSDQMVNDKIGNIAPLYVKPNVDGALPFDDGSFDLITCFGTLHHIPNVGFVIREMIRVLKPNGYILLREPIQSMGDWRGKRAGLTKNERGIPVRYFEELFKVEPVDKISVSYCFCLTTQFKKLFKPVLKRPIHFYRPYILFDKLLSRTLTFNLKYHPVSIVHRFAPTSVFYVLRRQ